MGLRLFLWLPLAPPIHIIWLTMEVGGSLLPQTLSSLAFHDTKLLTSEAAPLSVELAPCSVLVWTKISYCQFDNSKQGLYKVTEPWRLPLSMRLSCPLKRTSWGWGNSSIGKGLSWKDEDWVGFPAPNVQCHMKWKMFVIPVMGKQTELGSWVFLASQPGAHAPMHVCSEIHTKGLDRKTWSLLTIHLHQEMTQCSSTLGHSAFKSPLGK